MDLNIKLTQLEEHIDKVLQELASFKSENENLKGEYDALLTKLMEREEELERCNNAKDEAKRRVESILSKLG